jgi:hypothetical protein
VENWRWYGSPVASDPKNIISGQIIAGIIIAIERMITIIRSTFFLKYRWIELVSPRQIHVYLIIARTR